ncbi:MAG: hypothetical protein H0U53_02970 [Actinobacteria bacterium]|nr:hypothetical protein [Actinomycetota bacterium]
MPVLGRQIAMSAHLGLWCSGWSVQVATACLAGFSLLQVGEVFPMYLVARVRPGNSVILERLFWADGCALGEPGEGLGEAASACAPAGASSLPAGRLRDYG